MPNKGARRGAKCASAAHEGGAPLGFQPVHTPGQTRRSSRGVGDIPDTASSPRRHRYRGAHASPPLSQPPVRYRPLDLNFSTLQCSAVLLYDLGILYTVLTVYSTRSGYLKVLYDLACMTHLITAKIYELSMQTSRGQGQITVEF